MGGQHTGKRKYILFYAACLYVIGIASGCAAVRENLAATGSMHRAETLMEAGKFEDALAENARALESPLKLQTDMKIYQRAMIYGHPRNMNRDMVKATVEFKRLIRKFPDSPLAEPARALLIYFEEMEFLENCNKKLQETIGIMDRALGEKESAMQTCDEKARDLQADVENLKNRVSSLEAQIEKYKTIDLNIQERRQN